MKLYQIKYLFILFIIFLSLFSTSCAKKSPDPQTPSVDSVKIEKPATNTDDETCLPDAETEDC